MPQVLARHLSHPLERNAYALALNAAITAALGLAYWAIAARSYTPHAVGENSALVSAMIFVSTCANLNLAGAMTHFLPRSGPAAATLIRTGYAAAAGMAAALATAFVVVAPALSSRLEFFRTSTALAAGFCAAVVMWTIFAVQDGVLTGLRRAVVVPVENAVFAAAKLALLLPLAVALPAYGIFASWTAPLLLLLAGVNLLVFRRLLPVHVADTADRAALVSRRRVARFVAGDYLGSLFLQGSTTLLPVFVAATLGAGANAEFYAAFLLVSAVDVMALNVGASLTVEASRERGELAALVRRTARIGILLLVPAVLVMTAAAPLLLSLFGEDYANSAQTALRLLAVGLAFKSVTILYISACRALGAVRRIVATEAATFVLVASLSVLLVGPYGMDGVAIAWLIAQSVVALVVLPRLLALVRPGVEHRG